MALKDWSTTAASNTSASPDGAPEGWAPSEVNNWARETMAQVRTQCEDMEWFDWGHTPTYVSATSFTVTGDQTGTYVAGRRIKCTDASTLYGTISSSSFSSNTTVNVTLDSGSLSGSLTAVSLGILTPTNDAIPENVVGKLATTNVFTKTQTFAKGADIASATALTLGTDGNYFDVTGTTAITSISSAGVGTVLKLHFDGALTLTHHATDLILPGGANITTAAGDEAEFVEYASGDFRCTNYTKADGTAVVDATGMTVATPVATTSGTGVSMTGIPSGTKQITFMLDGVSTNGTSHLILQIGVSGGIEATGYTSTASTIDTGVNSSSYTTGFGIRSGTASAVLEGSIILTLIDSSANTWIAQGVLTDTATGNTIVTSGNKSLTGEITRVRIKAVNGTDTFDAGQISIAYI